MTKELAKIRFGTKNQYDAKKSAKLITMKAK